MSSKEGKWQEEVLLSGVIKLPEFSVLSTHCGFRSWWCQRAGIPDRIVDFTSLWETAWIRFSLQDVVQSFLHEGFLVFHLFHLWCLPFLLSWSAEIIQLCLTLSTLKIAINTAHSYLYLLVSTWCRHMFPEEIMPFLQLLYQCSLKSLKHRDKLKKTWTILHSCLSPEEDAENCMLW